MPRHKGIWREQWLLCDRCQFEHPISMLVRQKGLLLCTDHGCLDNLDVERRPFVIGRILEDPNEFVDEREKVQRDPGEIPVF